MTTKPIETTWRGKGLLRYTKEELIDIINLLLGAQQYKSAENARQLTILSGDR